MLIQKAICRPLVPLNLLILREKQVIGRVCVSLRWHARYIDSIPFNGKAIGQKIFGFA